MLAAPSYERAYIAMHYIFNADNGYWIPTRMLKLLIQIKGGRSSSDRVRRRKTPLFFTGLFFVSLKRRGRCARISSVRRNVKIKIFFYMNKITRSIYTLLTDINHWSKSKPYISPVSLIFGILWYHPNHLSPCGPLSVCVWSLILPDACLSVGLSAVSLSLCACLYLVCCTKLRSKLVDKNK
jgi:hypothetical protein